MRKIVLEFSAPLSISRALIEPPANFQRDVT